MKTIGEYPDSTLADETALVPQGHVGEELATETRDLQPIPRWRLLVRSGPEEGRTIELEGGRVSVGRSPRCAIRLEDPSVSRLHLWVEPRPEGVFLCEESTKNGTTLDGVPCPEGLAREGQRIGLGQTILEVERIGEGKGGGIVEQAMRVLRGGEAPRAAVAPSPRPWSRKRRWLVALGAMLGGLALLALPLGSEPPPAEEAERVEGPLEARRAFDEGIARMKAGDRGAARALFAQAAKWDPQSEEPDRYLRWLREDRGLVRPRQAPFEEEMEAEIADEELEPLPALGASEDEEGLQPKEDDPSPAPGLTGAGAGPRPAKPQKARPKRAARRGVEDAARWQALRGEIRALLDRAADEEGVAAVESLRAAWEKARSLRGEKALLEEAGARLAAAAFEVAEDALALGRLGRAVSHYQLVREVAPEHGGAMKRLASLEARAESFLVEGYSLLERDPARARTWLELVLALKGPEDPLHQRAEKWLAATRAGAQPIGQR